MASRIVMTAVFVALLTLTVVPSAYSCGEQREAEYLKGEGVYYAEHKAYRCSWSWGDSYTALEEVREFSSFVKAQNFVSNLIPQLEVLEREGRIEIRDIEDRNGDGKPDFIELYNNGDSFVIGDHSHVFVVKKDHEYIAIGVGSEEHNMLFGPAGSKIA